MVTGALVITERLILQRELCSQTLRPMKNLTKVKGSSSEKDPYTELLTSAEFGQHQQAGRR